MGSRVHSPLSLPRPSGLAIFSVSHRRETQGTFCHHHLSRNSSRILDLRQLLKDFSSGSEQRKSLRVAEGTW